MNASLLILAQATVGEPGGGAYRYTEPFIQPLPVWDYWALLLLPLCLAIAVVYKAVRSDSMARVPKEALQLFAFIVVVMVVAAGALAALVNIIQR